jgi:glutamate dehydrogenase/leucine dehydrogenase
LGEWVERRVEGRHIVAALGIAVGEEPRNLVEVRELHNLAEERELRIVVVGVGRMGVVAEVHHMEAGHKVVAVVVLHMAVVRTGAAEEELRTEVADHREAAEEEHRVEAVDRTAGEEAHCMEAVEEEEHHIVVVRMVVEGILYYCQLVPRSIQLFIGHLRPGGGALYP